jgi:ABC-2 type transport system permease protein
VFTPLPFLRFQCYCGNGVLKNIQARQVDMKKYWKTISNEFQRQLNLRFFILSFVVGNFFDLLAQIVIWSAAFKFISEVNGYDYRTMLTYVIFGWIFRYLTTNYEYDRIIQKDIHLGRLSNFMVKPINYIRYIMANAIGRNIFAFMVVIVMSLIWIIFFGHVFVFQNSAIIIPILLAYFVLAYLIKFYLSILAGFIGFWTVEVTGISYSINIIIKFLSGAYFPIDLLGSQITSIFYFFPFVYTFFIPAQIFVGKIGIAESFNGIAVMLIWILALHAIVKIIWTKGLKKYESAGI